MNCYYFVLEIDLEIVANEIKLEPYIQVRG